MNDIAGTIEKGNKARFTLYAEHIPDKYLDVQRKVMQFFDGATFYFGEGIFQSTVEKNITVTVIAFDGDENRFMAMSEEIRALLSQKEVWVTKQPIELTILSIPETARKDREVSKNNKWYDQTHV